MIDVSHSAQVINVEPLAVSVKSVSILVPRLSFTTVFKSVSVPGVGISSFVNVHVTSSHSPNVRVDPLSGVEFHVQTRLVFV